MPGEVLRVPTAGADHGRPAAGRRPRRARLASPSSGSAAPPASPPATSATPPRWPSPCPPTTPSTSRAVADGFLLGGYSFKRYKSRSRRGRGRRRRRCSATRPGARTRSPRSTTPQDGRRAREPGPRLGQHPAERPDPRAVRRRGAWRWARSSPAAASPRSTIEVLGVEELAALGCGGILGVGQGSANPPRMVKLTWQPEDARASVAFVGKGITYDSGGLTIKPGSSMATMKYDMGGAAAVSPRPSRSPSSTCRSP